MGSLAGSLCASLAPSLTSASGTIADTVVPRIKLISVPAAGTSVSFQYYEKMDSATVPAASDLSLSGTSATLADPGVWANDTLTFPTTGTIYITDTPLTASYTAGTNKIRDLAHNNAANLVAAAVTNGSTQVAPSWPLPDSAVLMPDGETVRVTYGRTVSATTPLDSFSSVTKWPIGGGQIAEFVQGSVFGAFTDQLFYDFVLADKIPSSATGLYLDYALTPAIFDTDNNPASALVGFPVSNTSEFVDTTQPELDSVGAYGTTLEVDLTEQYLHSNVATGAISLTGTAATITAVDETGAYFFTLTLSQPIDFGAETPVVASTATVIHDLSGNALVPFSGIAVEDWN
jgi:hypothetical protein